MQQIDLTPTLTVFESRAAGGTHCGLIRATDDGVILIDPGILPDELAVLREATDSHRVHLIVQTHAHWDHVFGLTTWPDAPRAASTMFGWMRDQASLMLEAVLSHIEGEYGPFEPRPGLLEPTRLIARREPLHEAVPGWEIIPAPGHSVDMLVVYDASTSTLWAADILSDREPPTLFPGTTAEYLATLGLIAGLDVERLVPAHGSIVTSAAGVRARIAADREYLIELRGRVQRALDEGGTLEEAIAACADMQFVSAEVYRDLHADNVKMVWGELRGLSDYDDEEPPEHDHSGGGH